MVLQRYLPEIGFDLSRIFILVGPQIEHNPVRSASSISVSLWRIFIYWTGYNYQITAVDTGSIEEVPDQFKVFKGGHNVKDLGATTTYVDGS